MGPIVVVALLSTLLVTAFSYFLVSGIQGARLYLKHGPVQGVRDFGRNDAYTAIVLQSGMLFYLVLMVASLIIGMAGGPLLTPPGWFMPIVYIFAFGSGLYMSKYLRYAKRWRELNG